MSNPNVAPDWEVDALVARAVATQRAFASWPEARVDALLQEIAETIAERAEHLAAATVAETGIGSVPDKTITNRFASLGVYQALAGQPGMGPLRVDPEHQVTEIGSPVGVVLGLIPVTNPVASFVFKTLIALKGRNALILSCHCDALGIGKRTGDLIQMVLLRHSAPVDLVQWVRQSTSRTRTLQLMRHKDVAFILATGVRNLIQVAYSSGTPAIGMTPGNTPAWICADADLQLAAQLVVQSKRFDHGVIYGSEQHLVVEAAVREAFIAALESYGAAVLTGEESEHFTTRAFDPADGRLRRELIGQAAQRIAHMYGIRRQHPIAVIVVPIDRAARSGPYGREKLAPILSLFTVAGEADGLEICRQLLVGEPPGQTAILHTSNQTLADQFGLAVPASRILVNLPGVEGCIGSRHGRTPAFSLGHGTFVGRSSIDNVSYTQLLNIKRVATAQAPAEDGSRQTEAHADSYGFVGVPPHSGRGDDATDADA